MWNPWNHELNTSQVPGQELCGRLCARMQLQICQSFLEGLPIQWRHLAQKVVFFTDVPLRNLEIIYVLHCLGIWRNSSVPVIWLTFLLSLQQQTFQFSLLPSGFSRWEHHHSHSKTYISRESKLDINLLHCTLEFSVVSSLTAFKQYWANPREFFSAPLYCCGDNLLGEV